MKEHSLNQERLKMCTFEPKKYSTLEFEYSEEFKDPSTRLYNNYFEVQDKLAKARVDRNKEIRSRSETRSNDNMK